MGASSSHTAPARVPQEDGWWVCLDCSERSDLFTPRPVSRNPRAAFSKETIAKGPPPPPLQVDPSALDRGEDLWAVGASQPVVVVPTPNLKYMVRMGAKKMESSGRSRSVISPTITMENQGEWSREGKLSGAGERKSMLTEYDQRRKMVHNFRKDLFDRGDTHLCHYDALFHHQVLP